MFAPTFKYPQVPRTRTFADRRTFVGLTSNNDVARSRAHAQSRKRETRPERLSAPEEVRIQSAKIHHTAYAVRAEQGPATAFQGCHQKSDREAPKMTDAAKDSLPGALPPCTVWLGCSFICNRAGPAAAKSCRRDANRQKAAQRGFAVRLMAQDTRVYLGVVQCHLPRRK